MKAANARRVAAIITTSTLALSLSACSWFRGKPAPAAPVASYAPTAVPLMRSACPNSTAVWAGSPFPRAAIARGLTEGQVTIRFRVDGRQVDIVEVTATDPTFGEAAAAVVKRYECAVDQPTTFEMAFAYKRG